LLTIFSRASHGTASKNARFLKDFNGVEIKSSHAVVLARSSHEIIHALLTKPSRGLCSCPGIARLSERFAQSVFSRVYSRASQENQGASEEALEKIASYDFLSLGLISSTLNAGFPLTKRMKNIHPLRDALRSATPKERRLKSRPQDHPAQAARNGFACRQA
jgi:hypothetical protein